ncbi:MAG: hypothetical protein J6O49_18190 [Bacteroidaceae bacterium]|nr:hypothetical protein [Bacteroidaceae bacterium]
MDKIYFAYKEAPYFRSKWMLYVLILMVAVVIIVEMVWNVTAYSLAVTIPILLLYLYFVLRHKEKIDKATEKKIVEKKLQKIIEKLCKDKRVKEIWSDYYIVVPKQQYLPIKRFLLVGLSDGKVCKFKVSHTNDDRFAIDMNPEFVENDSKMTPLIKKKEGRNPKVKAERIMSYIAASVLLIGFIIIALTLWLGSSTEWMQTAAYILIGDFFLALIVETSLSRFEKSNRLIGFIYRTAFWNLQILRIIIMLLLPSMLLIMGLMVVVLFPFAIILMVLKSLATIAAISSQTILFVSLTLGAIISGHYSGPLFGWLSRALTANGHRYEKYFQELVEYVYKPSNIQFVVYLLYVVYLSVSTIYRFETSGSAMIGNDKDLAILESFLVFIAFSNMKSKRTSADFRLAEIFRIMFNMWTTHNNIEEDLKDEGE